MAHTRFLFKAGPPAPVEVGTFSPPPPPSTLASSSRQALPPPSRQAPSHHPLPLRHRPVCPLPLLSSLGRHILNPLSETGMPSSPFEGRRALLHPSSAFP
eukprot:353100-Chlamydomonas_euryale.AAC.1